MVLLRRKHTALEHRVDKRIMVISVYTVHCTLYIVHWIIVASKIVLYSVQC